MYPTLIDLEDRFMPHARPPVFIPLGSDERAKREPVVAVHDHLLQRVLHRVLFDLRGIHDADDGARFGVVEGPGVAGGGVDSDSDSDKRSAPRYETCGNIGYSTHAVRATVVLWKTY